jgi:hypothetical protein
MNIPKKMNDFCVPDNPCLHVLQPVTCVAFFCFIVIF